MSPLVVARRATLPPADEELAEHYAQYFRAAAEWTFFATLTFARRQTPRSMLRAFAAWIAELERRAGGALRFVVTVDRGQDPDHLHLHALLELPPDGKALRARTVEATWGLGRAEVARFDPACGGAWYIAEKVVHASRIASDGEEYVFGLDARS